MKALKLALPLILMPGLALAHPGHGTGFLAGVTHPLTGADHLLAMLAIGLCAAMLGGRAVWALPLAFTSALAAGGVLGHAAGFAVPGVEQAILASLMVLGVASALGLRLPLALALPAVAGFGLVHGLAHGAGASGAFLPYAAGFVLTSAALHGAGLLIGRQARLAQVLGGLTAMTGVALAFAG